jgi:hypothetical protein
LSIALIVIFHHFYVRKKFMRLKKLVPMAGFCAVSFLSSSAMGEAQWLYHCETQKCLDAAYKGRVQVSECHNDHQAQKWEKDTPSSDKIKNSYWSFKYDKDQCLDMYNGLSVHYNNCDSNKQAQTWESPEATEVWRVKNLYQLKKQGNQCLYVDTNGTNDPLVKGQDCIYAEGLIPTRQKWKWVSVGTTGEDICNLNTTKAMSGKKTKPASLSADITFGPLKVGTLALDTLEKLRAEIKNVTQHIEQFEKKEANVQQVDWGKIVKIVRQLIDAYRTFEVAVKAPLPPIEPVFQWEYVQNLSAEDQEWYWHTPQGTYLMPYTWFLALEVPEPWKKFDSKALATQDFAGIISQFIAAKQKGSAVQESSTAGLRFASPNYLARFGMLTLPQSKYNPDGLPAGLTKQDNFVDPTVPNSRKQTVLGMGCALCHTGKVQYNNKTLYIDGAPAQTSLDLFGAKLAVSLIQTLLPDSIIPLHFSRFNRFATNVYGHKPTTLEWFTLYIKLATYLIESAQDAGSGLPSTLAGFFRLDALDSIGNQVFGVEIDPKVNMGPTTAPVSYPMLWTVPWLAWAEYPGVVRSPMIRNVGEALGVKAPINLTTADLNLLYKSTVLVDELYRFETLLMENYIPIDIKTPPTEDPWEYVKQHKALPGLQPPSWEAAAAKGLLPPINNAKLAAGKELYEELCQSCHLPPLNDPAIGNTDAEGNLNSAYWEPKSADEGVAPQFQRQFLKVKKLNIQEIGTDPQTVLNFAQRFPDFANMTWGPESGIVRNINTTDADGTQKVGQTMTMADGLKYTTQAAAYRWYRDNGITDKDTIVRLNGYRPNVVLLEPTYRARPLDGIWATGPFLHNGSVANLYELLLPASQRANEFIVGDTEFDPRKVGFKSYERDTPAKRAKKVKEGYTLFTVNYLNSGKPILGNSNAGHEFKDDGKVLGEGILGRALSDTERYELIEYLKTL